MSVVEVGQYFVTRSANEFLLKTVACREYTLPRDDPASEAKGWIQGNTRIGPTGCSALVGPSRACADQIISFIRTLHLFYYHFFLGKTQGSYLNEFLNSCLLKDF